MFRFPHLGADAPPFDFFSQAELSRQIRRVSVNEVDRQSFFDVRLLHSGRNRIARSLVFRRRFLAAISIGLASIHCIFDDL
jgi:hypothetical protein